MRKFNIIKYLAGCAVAALAASASPADAHVVTFDFTGSLSFPGATTSVSSGGATVNVAALNSNPGFSQIVRTMGGFGVFTPGQTPSDQLAVDGIDPNESLLFAFNAPVRIRSITFTAVDNSPDGEDLVVMLGSSTIVLGLTFPGGPNIASMGACAGDLSGDMGVCTLDWSGVTPLDLSFNPVSTTQMAFLFGAVENDDNFFISSLTVEVAEPATAALLLTGLLGPAFIARRRRK